jgi:hypothetical protein
MATDTEVVTDGTIPREEGIDPFDWEDHLYESWLEEPREKEIFRSRAALPVNRYSESRESRNQRRRLTKDP